MGMSTGAGGGEGTLRVHQFSTLCSCIIFLDSGYRGGPSRGAQHFTPNFNIYLY